MARMSSGRPSRSGVQPQEWGRLPHSWAPRIDSQAVAGNPMAPASKSQDKKTWTIRFSEKILKEDFDDVGHAGFEMARRVIDKKLRIAPDQYGPNLHHPLHAFRKLKSSDIRIVYRVDANASDVLVLMIGNRRDIWESEQEEILERYEVEKGRAILAVRSLTAKKRKHRKG